MLALMERMSLWNSTFFFIQTISLRILEMFTFCAAIFFRQRFRLRCLGFTQSVNWLFDLTLALRDLLRSRRSTLVPLWFISKWKGKKQGMKLSSNERTFVNQEYNSWTIELMSTSNRFLLDTSHSLVRSFELFVESWCLDSYKGKQITTIVDNKSTRTINMSDLTKCDWWKVIYFVFVPVVWLK